MTSEFGTAGEPFPDALTSLAFALQRNLGAYAVLLGAGISAPSGVPTAWDVENSLIRDVALMHAESPEKPVEWYVEKFGVAPRYDDLLKRLAHTPTERQALLQKPFMRDTTDDDSDSFKPTSAHRSLARLVASGRIKVVLTTNFDQLVETALRDIDIEPVVVREASQLNGLPPLHMLDCLVVHLHGDFLTPAALLNTSDELSKYPRKLDRLLDRIFSEYGLIIVGWSAEWDTALRTALARNTNRHFSRYWIDNRSLPQRGTELLTQCGAIFVKATADDALGRVVDACDAIASTNARGPFTVGTAVATAKKALAGNRTAISLHDSIAAELNILRNCHVLKEPLFDAANRSEVYTRRLNELEVAMAVPASLIATTAYWGNTQTDGWWFGEIARFATWRPASGATALIELLRVPAVAFMYAAGVAATASGRFDLVRRLLVEPTTLDNTGKTVRVSSDLTYSKVIYVSRSGKYLFDYLQPTFVDHLALGYEAFQESWERFEFLRVLEDAYARISEKRKLDEIVRNRRTLVEVERREISETVDADSRERLAEIEIDVTNTYQSGIESRLGDVQAHNPFLRIDGRLDNYRAQVVVQIRHEVERDGQFSPLVVGGLCGGDAEALLAVLDVVDLALARAAHWNVQSAWTTGTSVPQSPFWMDNPRDHVE